jgi:hypothetical protein
MRFILLMVLVGPALLLVAPAPFDPVPTRTAAAEQEFDPGLMAVKPLAKPPAKRLPGLPYWSNDAVIGWVTAVDAKSITVLEGGPGAEPVRFTACQELVAGQVIWVHQHRVPPYPLADVRVGDLVKVFTIPPMVYEIYIWRRPGGRLGPPSVVLNNRRIPYNVDLCNPDPRITKPRPYHEWVNAIQDYEERGILLPPDMRLKQRWSTPILGCVIFQDGTVKRFATLLAPPAQQVKAGEPPPQGVPPKP